MSALNKNLIFEVGSQSNPGLKKEHNEDEVAHFSTVNGEIWIICNGINGEQGGAALAAKLASKSIGEYFKNKKYSNLLNALNNSILFANHQVFDHVEKNKHLAGMATTIAIVLVRDDKMYYAYAGNTRIYIRRKDKLQLLTKDHTTVQQLIDKGEITAEQAKTHEKKGEIYNLLGLKKEFKFSTCKNPINILEDDMLLVASDGLTNELDNDAIDAIISDPDASVQHKSLQLVEQANKAGGNDNISLHLIGFFKEELKKKKTSFKTPKAPKKEKEPKTPKAKNESLKLIPYILIGIVLAVVIYFSYDLFFSKSSPELTENKTVIEEKKPEKELEDVVEFDSLDSDLRQTQDVEQTQQDDKLFAEDVIEESLTSDQPVLLEYQIGKGENFYRLGIRFNVTVKELEEVNNIVSTRLQANQKVKIPLRAIHTVKKGDVLGAIAENYGVTADKIMRANKMQTENLSEGQTLYIPRNIKK